MLEIREYVDEEGRNAFGRWFRSLDAGTRARLSVYLARLRNGNLLAVKGVGQGVFELRLDFGPGFRVYFGRDGECLVILLAGGSKQRQQLDIEAARASWQQYKQRKRDLHADSQF